VQTALGGSVSSRRTRAKDATVVCVCVNELRGFAFDKLSGEAGTKLALEMAAKLCARRPLTTSSKRVL
jgi:hypothetical protein